MPIEVNNTTITAVTIDSKRVGLVLAGDKAVFADFDNGDDAGVGDDTIFLNDYSSSWELFDISKNVYNTQLEISGTISNLITSKKNNEVKLKFFYLEDTANFLEILLHFENYSFSTGSSAAIEFNRYIDGTKYNYKTYSYSDGNDSVGNKYGIRVLNNLMVQWYYQAKNSQSITTTGDFMANPINFSSNFKSGRPRVEIWVKKEYEFTNEVSIHNVSKYYQRQSREN